jgi:pyruvate,water dikinase
LGIDRPIESGPTEQADVRVLTDEEVRAVADLVRRHEGHYRTAQDIEWAIEDGRTHLVQSRPVTTHMQPAGSPGAGVERKELVRGLAASPGTVVGTVRVVRTPADADSLQPGEILVATRTACW